MDSFAGSGKCTIAKGFINGRDPSGTPVYGLFIAAASREKLEYLDQLFSYEQMDTNAPWEELIGLLGRPRMHEADSPLARYEKGLHDFIDIHRLFQSTKGHLDPKQIERKISYFCADMLDVNAITFLELSEVEPENLKALFPSLRETEEQPDVPEPEAKGGEADEESGESAVDAADGEIFVACEPILDPVSGVALNDLQIGDVVACRLPEDSSFYKFFANGFPNFDGNLRGIITGIQLNEHGIATVALKLADGVSGALRLSGKVRIKLLAKGEEARRAGAQPSLEVILAFSSIVVFLGIMGVLLYKLS